MASNLSTIGFTFADDADFEQTMLRLASEARERLVTKTGEYVIWRSRTGAEVWFHLGSKGTNGSDEREIIGLTPYFEGESNVPASITERYQRNGDNPLEGMLHVWVAPDDIGTGSYPLVVDALDYAAHVDRELPLRVSLRIAGFCRELRVFDTAAAMLASDDTAKDEAQLAPESLIPVGLFADDEDGENRESPMPTALIRGSVISHRRLVNEVTGHPFHVMLVKTLDATLDLLVDSDLVENEPRFGSSVEAYAWMFARVLS